MFCKKCGAQLPDGTKFCSRCGTSLTGEKVEKTIKKIRFDPKALFAGIKKKYAIAIGVIAAVLAVAVLLLAVFILPNLEVNEFKKCIKNREYRDAYLVYEDFVSEDRTKANKWMREYISSVEKNYYAGKLDYSTVTDVLEELMQFDAAYNDATKAGEAVYLDNQSSIAFEKAKSYAEEKKWQEAYRELQNVHVKYRLYDEVSALRTECTTNVRADAIKQFNDFATNGEIDKLIAVRDSTLQILPDDKEIIQAAQTQLDAFVKKTLADAAAFAENKDFTSAKSLLRDAIHMYDHQDLRSAMEGYGYDSAAAHCEALAAQNDLLGAVKYAKGLADNDSKYDDLLIKYATTLVSQTLAKAKSYADNRHFTEAINCIKTIQEVYDNTELQNAVEEYSKFLPRKLSDCHLLDGTEGRISEKDQVDSFGKEHKDSIRFADCFQSTFAIYSLEGRYAKFSGTIVADEDHRSSAVVKIYIDDKLLYESKSVSRTTEAFDFSVDIAGGKQLKIEVLNNNSSNWSYVIIDATVS